MNYFQGFRFNTGGGTSPAGVPHEAQAVVDEAAHIRGWCVQCFAQVEFILAALVEKSAAKWPDDYSELAKTMPYTLQSRKKRVRELIAKDGPLSAHAHEIAEIIDGLDEREDFRHLIVHGWSDITLAKNGLFLGYRLYKPKPENPWHVEHSHTTIATMRLNGHDFQHFANAAVLYFGQLFLKHELEKDIGPNAVGAPPVAAD